MRKFRNILIGLIIIFILTWFFAIRYLNSGSLEPDNTVWTPFIGRDTTVGILPDAYANYYTYTLGRTKDNIGFKIKGDFPDTRYFSFNVYSLADNATQGSLVDYQILTDSGRPNPFLSNKDSIEVGKKFTVHIIPEKYKRKEFSNLLTFRDNVKLLTMVIRLYDYNIDDFGGVEFPSVEAFSIEEESQELDLKSVNLPKGLNLRWIVRNKSLPGMVRRLGILFETEKMAPLDASLSNNKYNSIPFHSIDSRGYIENNDNRYLLAGITKKNDEVYVFRFKSPSFTTGPENIGISDVRYWSFNLGNSATYNFNAIKDEDAFIDANGYVNIILASKDIEIEERARELGYNFLEWNMRWEKGLILFRHMLAKSNFEAQIENVPQINLNTVDFTSTEAQKHMGDFAPHGIRMSKKDFLFEYGLQNEAFSK